MIDKNKVLNESLLTSNNLDELVDAYKQSKDVESEFKKYNETLNKNIKSIFIEKQLDEYSTDNFTAKLSIRDNCEFNDDKAIMILKENLSPDMLSYVVKTKEYIDEDALENLIYNKDIDPNLLLGCKIYNEPTYVLTVKNKSKK